MLDRQREAELLDQARRRDDLPKPCMVREHSLQWIWTESSAFSEFGGDGRARLSCDQATGARLSL